MNGVTPTSGDFANATAIATALAACTIDLFQNNISVVKSTPVGSLEVATFTGYTQQTVATPGPPVIDPVLGGVSIIMPSKVFAAASPYTVGNTIYGWYLRDATGALIAAGNFPTPINVGGLGQAVPLTVTLNFQD
jgi:hypothetical protein